MTNKQRQSALTLPEMLIAVAITVGMLLVTGLVFKSATDASGTALAHNEVMSQLRSLTRQLETDFAGLRPDMPIAIIFELDPATNLRHDRIAFFANGDFQVNDYVAGNPNISANMARIYYGQSFDSRPLPPNDFGMTDRWPLLRRYKILTQNWGQWGPTYTEAYAATSPERYDYRPIDDLNTVAGWKNLIFVDYTNSLFLSDPTNPSAIPSLVRRPNLAAIEAEMNTSGTGVGRDAIQKVYFLPDVTDFKIQVWYPASIPFIGGRWSPNNNDINFNPFHPGQPFAWGWNIQGAPPSNTSTKIDNFYYWYCSQPGLGEMPLAIKFTFTLYDNGRRRFNEGQTYSYIVELPERN